MGMAKGSTDPEQLSPELRRQVSAFRAKVSAELSFLQRVQTLIAMGKDAEAEAEIRAYYRDESRRDDAGC